MITTLVAARVVRAFGFGLMSVAFALYLGGRGFTPFAIGATLTFALLSGAVFLAASASIVRVMGRRNALLCAAAAMCAAGVLLGLPGNSFPIIVACLLGTLSAGAQEVGPFAAIEQHAVADAVTAQTSAHSFAIYNLAGAFALALGALAAAVIPIGATPLSYAACGLALFVVYLALPHDLQAEVQDTRAQRPRQFGAAERLALLFGVDALAGGFVVQSFLAYWLHVRFGADEHILGLVLFGANTLSALSYLVAARLSQAIGLLRTMVFTHLPSNILLCIVPLMPSFESASAVLLARFALSQMDVPTRQAFTMEAVGPEDRAYAAALTNAVRPAAAAIAPVFSGLAMQAAYLALPFFVAGGLKIAYDIAIFRAFRGGRPIQNNSP
jgi:predicted MFS family arabinose efflux permease